MLIFSRSTMFRKSTVFSRYYNTFFRDNKLTSQTPLKITNDVCLWSLCRFRSLGYSKTTMKELKQRPFLKGFMDAMRLMSSSVAGAKDLLSCCTTALTWAGMSYRGDKSCSIEIIKGRSMNSTSFSMKKTINTYRHF